MKSFKLVLLSAGLLLSAAASAQSGLQNGSGTSVPVQGTPSNAGTTRHRGGNNSGTNTSATIADDNSTGKAPLVSDGADKTKSVRPDGGTTDSTGTRWKAGKTPK